MRLEIRSVTGAPNAESPKAAALAWAGPDVTSLWSQQHEDIAVVVLSPGPFVVLCRRASDWTVAVENNQLGFLSYDGTNGPWVEGTHDPLGVIVAQRDAGLRVSAVRCRTPDGDLVEEPANDRRWHTARWDVRMWRGGPPWPAVEAILVDGLWQRPVTPELAKLEEDLFHQSLLDIDAEVWHLFDHLNAEDPSRAWALVRKIIDHVDDDELGLLGAGQLENIFRDESEVFFPYMAAAAREDPRVARALAGIWAYEATMRNDLDALLAELGIDPRMT